VYRKNSENSVAHSTRAKDTVKEHDKGTQETVTEITTNKM
jgi:hypothetical protein